MKSCAASALLWAVSSHPARGGWIEIRIYPLDLSMEWVPPRTGWVD